MGEVSKPANLREAIAAGIEAVNKRQEQAHTRLWQVDEKFDAAALIPGARFGEVALVDVPFLVSDVVDALAFRGLASVGVSEQAVEAATDAVMHDYALFRDPRYGTELTRSEILEIMRVGLEAVAAQERGDAWRELVREDTVERERLQAEMDRRLDVLRRFADHWLKIGTDDEQLVAAHDFFVAVLDPPALGPASTPTDEDETRFIEAHPNFLRSIVERGQFGGPASTPDPCATCEGRGWVEGVDGGVQVQDDPCPDCAAACTSDPT